MRKKVLICGLALTFYYDTEGHVYINQSLGWLDRFRGLDVDYYFVTMGKKIERVDGLIRLDSVFNVKETIFVSDLTPTNIISACFQTWRSVSKVMRKVDGVMMRYQGFQMPIICFLARKYKKKTLLEIGGDLWDALWNHGILGKIIAPPIHLLCKYDMKHADFAHYVTQKYLQRVYPTDGVILSLSNVELAPFSDETLKKRLEKISSKTETDPFILGTAAGVNVRYKGQQYVIQALSILKKKGFNNFRYDIAGKGDNTYLKNVATKYGVEDQVVFKGTLSHSEIFDWLDSIDIYIQPSLQEGLPRAMVEAMSRALPCIGANTAGIPELIDFDFIYKEKKSPEVIADYILKMLAQTGEQAHINFLKSKEFDFSVIKEKRVAFYNSFIEAI